MPVTDEQVRLVRRILRVNHAGAHGAIAIYNAQLKAAARYPEFSAWLNETLCHETLHREAFLTSMPSRGAKPCRALGIWSVGGATLGWITARFGRTGLMACTAAVERTVHRHLNDQIAYLDRRDPELAAVIVRIRTEELSHLAFAEAHHSGKGLFARSLSFIVAAATELLIWISTRGDSLRLKAALRAAGPA